ncbi:MAG TPA: hypothetical protein GXZ37_07210 [Clostridiales bacterium]|nr:hypothetical protein [Clostridiales bacterium]
MSIEKSIVPVEPSHKRVKLRTVPSRPKDDKPRGNPPMRKTNVDRNVEPSPYLKRTG